MSNKYVACRLLQDYGYVDVEYNLECVYECVYQRLKVGALKLRQRQYTIPNLSEEYFKRQWTLIKTRAPTSMQKTCLFTLTQLFLERYGDNYYMDLALWFLDCVDNYTSVSLC